MIGVALAAAQRFKKNNTLSEQSNLRGLGGRKERLGILTEFTLSSVGCCRAGMDGVWNYPTRSRDGASSFDDNSDTGPDHPDRDRGATPPRKILTVRTQSVRSPCAVTQSHRPRFPIPYLIRNGVTNNSSLNSDPLHSIRI